MQMSLDALRVVLGSILLIAAAAKFVNLKSFVTVVRGLQIGGETASLWIGTTLPLLEFFVGATLILARTWLWPAYSATALFVLFAAVMAVTLVRHKSAPDCGCFGSSGKVSWALVLRNLFLATLSVIVSLNGQVAVPIATFGALLLGASLLVKSTSSPRAVIE